jgi:uncharacterized protein
MATHVIIDGYNLLPVYAARLPFTEAAVAESDLLQALVVYRRVRRLNVTVVFDSYRLPPGAEQASSVGGVQVVYTSQGESADNAIARRAKKLKEAAIIITDDRELIRRCEAVGAVSFGCLPFIQKVELAEIALLKGASIADLEQDDQPVSRKKGNPRRTKKKNRARDRRLDKL